MIEQTKHADHATEEDEQDLDNYLDNLENESD